MFYSGKKKKHTVKTQLMVNNLDGLIIHKANYKKGKRHDYDIYKKNHPVTPKEVVNVFDLGYFGVEKDYPEQIRHYLAERRDTKSCLKKEDYNKVHSKKRIVVEHIICRLKKYKFLVNIFRNMLR